MRLEKVLESLWHNLRVLLIVKSAGNMRSSVRNVELVEPVNYVSL
jgi:hypothetical protein